MPYAERAIILSPVRLSDHPSVTQVGPSKTAEVRIVRDKFYPAILTGSLWAVALKKDWVGETSYFLYSVMRQYVENGTRNIQSYY